MGRLELTAGLKDLLGFAAEQLKGSTRRLFMAKTVNALGRGGQRLAERTLGWNRSTIRKGQHELQGKVVSIDAFNLRGRQKAEAHLPQLLQDIQTVVAPESQTDPSFKTTRLYTRLTAKQVRSELAQQPAYREVALPSVRTFDTKLNDLDFRLQAVQKSQPLKKIPETDAIFAQVHQFHLAVKEQAGVLRVSWDAKALVKIGLFSRGGRSRIATAAWDHDFTPETLLTPFNLFLPESDENFLYFTASKVTSDFMVDMLERTWPLLHERFHPEWLMIDGDNGPENQSHRTQFIKRMVEFAEAQAINVRLVYYPPYHSKYNPVERTWAALEHHWNGALLDSVDTVLRYAQTWTWKGKQAAVELINGIYQTGVKLTKAAMAVYERRIKRFPGLERWFVDIPACPV
ncbi:MAG TPA: ISAzo13 family transposase [Anaerolineae bacterium]